MADEPRNHKGFLIVLGFLSIGTIPLMFVGREAAFVAGIPVWLVVSVAASIGMAFATAWGFFMYWRDDDGD